MIPVSPQPEPLDFDAKVRQRGRRFLAAHRTPTSQDFKNHRYWKDAVDDLYRAYQGVCAYTGIHISRRGSKSVDHFKPKSLYPDLAYEWRNYRLALQKINEYKGDIDGIVDPFSVPLAWFILDFPSCLVKAGPGLAIQETTMVSRTITALHLNDDDNLVKYRFEFMLQLVEGKVTLRDVQDYFPFLAAEIIRHGGLAAVTPLFKKRP